MTLSCPNCGYDMPAQADGMFAPRCPECGSVFTRTAPVHAAAQRPELTARSVTAAATSP